METPAEATAGDLICSLSNLLPHMTHLGASVDISSFIVNVIIAHVASSMTSPPSKGKERETETPEVELTEAQKKQRSFERSLAGPSVGKAGLIRDQTGLSIEGCQD
jgi:hypothetical protein